MIVLATVVEGWLARHEVDFSGSPPVCWRTSRWAARQARGSEILCFGTSLSKFGLLPRVIEKRTGRRAYNLAVFSGPMPSSFFLLRQALEAGARPVAVVIDYQEGPIDRLSRHERPEGLTTNWRCWPELLDLRDCMDLAWSARDASFFAAISLAKLLPSYRVRFEIRSSILAALQGISASARPETLGLKRNLAFNRGAFVLPRNPEFQHGGEPNSAASAPIHHEPFPDRRWARNKLSVSYVQRFLDLAAAHGITVFWLMPPVSHDVQTHRDQNGLDDYFTRIARRAEAHSQHVIVIDGRRAGYPRRVFFDHSHLDRQGATTLTMDVVGIVDRYLADPTAVPRWVALPSFRELEPDVEVEAITQSRDFVVQRMTRR
jgi:hypothetical protein